MLFIDTVRNAVNKYLVQTSNGTWVRRKSKDTAGRRGSDVGKAKRRKKLKTKQSSAVTPTKKSPDKKQDYSGGLSAHGSKTSAAHGVSQTMMAEDQLLSVLKEPNIRVDRATQMQALGLTFAAFDERRPEDWRKLVCRVNNNYYKLYLADRFNTSLAVDGEIEKLVQNVTEIFQKAETLFTSDSVAWKMLALNQMLLMKSKRLEQEENKTKKAKRDADSARFTAVTASVDKKAHVVVDLCENSDNCDQKNESDEDVQYHKMPEKKPLRRLLGDGPVRIACKHWNGFNHADECIMGVGILEYDAEGKAWFTPAQGQL